MRLRKLPLRAAMVLLLAWSFGSAVAFGQEAIVTFYSHGSNLTTGLPGVGHDVYYGHIFDGTQGLFGFNDGFFLHNNRYLSLRLAPGTHTFGASNGKRPEARETLQVDLKPGESYFVRARGDSYGVPGVFTLQHGKLELIPCATAQEEMTNAKPLKDKALWKYTKARRAAMVIDETNPPPCP